MSAFVVSKAHIDALITAAKAHPYPSAFPQLPLDPPENPGPLIWDVQESPDAFGRALWMANVAGVIANYPHHDHTDDAREAMEYRFTPHKLDPASVLKQIECLEYQSDNVGDWESCWAKRFCAALRSAVIGTLPGYKAAPWGIG